MVSDEALAMSTDRTLTWLGILEHMGVTITAFRSQPNGFLSEACWEDVVRVHNRDLHMRRVVARIFSWGTRRGLRDVKGGFESVDECEKLAVQILFPGWRPAAGAVTWAKTDARRYDGPHAYASEHATILGACDEEWLALRAADRISAVHQVTVSWDQPGSTLAADPVRYTPRAGEAFSEHDAIVRVVRAYVNSARVFAAQPTLSPRFRGPGTITVDPDVLHSCLRWLVEGAP